MLGKREVQQHLYKENILVTMVTFLVLKYF